MAKQWLCRDCLYYPQRSRQPGSDMCVRADSDRSSDSRPCWPRRKDVLDVRVPWWRRLLKVGP